MRSTTRRLVVIATMVAVAGCSLTLSRAQTLKSVKQRSAKETGTSDASKVKLQPLNVKTGLWETTTTYKMAGELPIPPEMLNRLTPEQRARMEERMKARSGQSNTMTYQTCINKEDLENPDFTDRKQCTWTTLDVNSTHAKGSASCEPDAGMTMSGAGEIIVVDQEHVKGSLHMNATGNGRGMTTDTTFTSKWLHSECGNKR